MEDLQKALQEQGGKTEDVSAHLLPTWPSLMSPSNPPLSPPCCPMPREVHCKYLGPRVAPLIFFTLGLLNPPPLTQCFFSPPVNPAEEKAGGTSVSPRGGQAWVGRERLGQILWARIWC